MELISSEILITVKSKKYSEETGKRTDYREMTKRIFIGEENFEELISSRSVYIDKTWQIRNFSTKTQTGRRLPRLCFLPDQDVWQKTDYDHAQVFF